MTLGAADRRDWVDAIQDAQTRGYYDDRDRWNRAVLRAIEHRDHLAAELAKLESMLKTSQVVERSTRRRQRYLS